MPHLHSMARGAMHSAWLVGWRVKDSLAGVGRRVADGMVALTFDDGPHPSSTGSVLDLLGELRVPATFFCVGRNAVAYPALVARILAEGHALGSHSLSHPHPATTRLRALNAEYRDGHAAVVTVAERPVHLFRPPHGHLGYRSAVMVRRLGVSPWLWNVDPEDWRPGVTSRAVIEAASRADSGDVVLLHDWVEQPKAPEALDRSATIEALPRVVRAVKARGLNFTTLPT